MNFVTEGPAPEAHRAADLCKIPLGMCAISLAALAAFHNTLSMPLLFDDIQSVENSLIIRHVGSALRPRLETSCDAIAARAALTALCL